MEIVLSLKYILNLKKIYRFTNIMGSEVEDPKQSLSPRNHASRDEQVLFFVIIYNFVGQPHLFVSFFSTFPSGIFIYFLPSPIFTAATKFVKIILVVLHAKFKYLFVRV